MEITVSRASTTDLDKLRTLCDSTIESINRAHYNAEQIAAWRSRLTHERWKELTGGELQFLVAHDTEHRIVGFASIDPTGYLHSIFTHRHHQRQGVARTLLSHVENLACQMGATTLRAEVSITGRPFFERMGFCIQKEQTVLVNGVKMINFAAIKSL